MGGVTWEGGRTVSRESFATRAPSRSRASRNVKKNRTRRKRSRKNPSARVCSRSPDARTRPRRKPHARSLSASFASASDGKASRGRRAIRRRRGPGSRRARACASRQHRDAVAIARLEFGAHRAREPGARLASRAASPALSRSPAKKPRLAASAIRGTRGRVRTVRARDSARSSHTWLAVAFVRRGAQAGDGRAAYQGIHRVRDLSTLPSINAL